ncbi:Hypothetical predicted protein [Cloeon dipterum]|uniref:Uncharacterized protein n=1 Tax=Cloeon dipterum TaxID=197152 RepID=A0A8S1DGW5_9INSE|nr:Hypothetical predicted protein [Cloeon dipterum]
MSESEASLAALLQGGNSNSPDGAVISDVPVTDPGSSGEGVVVSSSSTTVTAAVASRLLNPNEGPVVVIRYARGFTRIHDTGRASGAMKKSNRYRSRSLSASSNDSYSSGTVTHPHNFTPVFELTPLGKLGAQALALAARWWGDIGLFSME